MYKADIATSNGVHTASYTEIGKALKHLAALSANGAAVSSIRDRHGRTVVPSTEIASVALEPIPPGFGVNADDLWGEFDELDTAGVQAALTRGGCPEQERNGRRPEK